MPKHHRPKKAPSPTYSFSPPHCPKNFNPAIIANFDGGMNGGRGGAPCWSWVIADPSGKEWDSGRDDNLPPGINPTSNSAEFMGMLECLYRSIPLAQGGPILIRGDSKLVIGAMHNGWRMPKSPWLAAIADRARKLLAKYPGPVFFEWVRRERNERADELGRGAEAQATLIAEAVAAERAAIVLLLRQEGYGEVALDVEELLHHKPARAEQDAV
jgi:ribonuclease HI